MSILLPVLCVAVFGYGIVKKCDVFGAFCDGVKRGLSVCGSLLPVLLLMITSVRAFRASGAMDALASFCAPLLQVFGVPEQILPLILIRPLSGGGSLSVCREIFRICGVDSFAGRVASVLSASTETTFYTVGVYLGRRRLSGLWKFLICAVVCDLVTVFLSVWVCRWLG